MTQETSKAVERRKLDQRFANRYLIGKGVDIGSGKGTGYGDDNLFTYRQFFPQMEECYGWDLSDGDAQYMNGAEDNSFDFVYSSHCLEHLIDPEVALSNWLRILKPNGHLIVMVPDEDLYEQRVWPSTFNGDHKHTFTTYKTKSWSPVSINLFELLEKFADIAYTMKIELIDHSFDYADCNRTDQTLGISESALEFVMKKYPS